jgi:hypothetical protein
LADEASWQYLFQSLDVESGGADHSAYPPNDFFARFGENGGVSNRFDSKRP